MGIYSSPRRPKFEWSIGSPHKLLQFLVRDPSALTSYLLIVLHGITTPWIYLPFLESYRTNLPFLVRGACGVSTGEPPSSDIFSQKQWNPIFFFRAYYSWYQAVGNFIIVQHINTHFTHFQAREGKILGLWFGIYNVTLLKALQYRLCQILQTRWLIILNVVMYRQAIYYIEL